VPLHTRPWRNRLTRGTATNSGGLIRFPLLFLAPNFVPRDMLTLAANVPLSNRYG
jgi:hypothetical protein